MELERMRRAFFCSCVLVLIFSSEIMGQSQVSPDILKNLVGNTQKEQSMNTFQTFDEPSGEPIDPDMYILGPGDKLYITLIGSVIKSHTVTITPTNDIVIPDAPPIPIANLKLSDAAIYLQNALANVFKNSKVKISLLQPRKIKVGVVLSGKSLDYVTVYGGTRVAEVVSKYVLERNERLIVESRLLSSQASDITQAMIVNQQAQGLQATQVMDKDKTADLDAISLRQIKVKRKDSEFIADADLYYKTQDNSKNPYVIEGDILVLSKKVNVVVISGHVKYPGVYEFVEGDSIHLIVKFAGGFLGTADVSRSRIIRNHDPRTKPNEEFLVDISNGKNFLLERNDVINISGRERSNDILVVTVKGEVRHPGVYGIKKGVTRIKEIIEQSGGFTQLAYMPASFVIRKEKISMYPIVSDPLAGIRYDDNPEMQYIVAQRRMKQGIVSIDLKKLYDGNESQNLLLESGDEIVIASIISYVMVIGRVVTPGKVEFVEGKDAYYYVEAAGGFGNRARSLEILIQKPNSGELLPSGGVKVQRGDVILVQEKAVPFIDEFARVAAIVGTVVGLILTGLTVYNTAQALSK